MRKLNFESRIRSYLILAIFTVIMTALLGFGQMSVETISKNPQTTVVVK